MSNSTPLVSIVCITYNHGEYLRSALEAFVSQKTNFPYEIVVHDDCSTDGTTDILREYAQKNPDKIVALYEEQNCYSRGIRFMQDLLTKTARGKYIALCEGDDLWCDTNKLQKQVDYLEAHPDCSLVMHNGYALNVQTGEKRPLNPYPGSAVLSIHDVLCEGKSLPPTASMMFPRHLLDEMPPFFLEAPVGDRPRRMFLALKGHVYYMQDLMCIYRMNVAGSFSERVKNDAVRKNCLDKMLEYFERYDQYTDGKYAQEIKYVKSRELFHYYMRGNQKWKAYHTSYYRQTYTAKEKMQAYVGLLLPEKAKGFIKKKLLK